VDKWPNLFIVGAPKAGTTSLHEYLKKIPGIYMSDVKEPYYFCKTMIPEDHYITPIRDTKKYLKLFNKAKDEKIIGESSVWYLSDPDSATLIHQKSPNAKIIILLRDPVERTFSHYLMVEGRKRFESSSFKEQIQKEIKHGLNYKIPNIRLVAGFYYDDIKRFLEIFGKDQVKIIFFEEFIVNPKEILYEILKFLDVNYSLDKFETKIHNASMIPKYSFVNMVLNFSLVDKLRRKLIPEQTQMSIRKKLFKGFKSKSKIGLEERNFLKNYYLKDVKKLEEFFGEKVPWPNFTDI